MKYPHRPHSGKGIRMSYDESKFSKEDNKNISSYFGQMKHNRFVAYLWVTTYSSIVFFTPLVTLITFFQFVNMPIGDTYVFTPLTAFVVNWYIMYYLLAGGHNINNEGLLSSWFAVSKPHSLTLIRNLNYIDILDENQNAILPLCPGARIGVNVNLSSQTVPIDCTVCILIGQGTEICSVNLLIELKIISDINKISNLVKLGKIKEHPAIIFHKKGEDAVVQSIYSQVQRMCYLIGSQINSWEELSVSGEFFSNAIQRLFKCSYGNIILPSNIEEILQAESCSCNDFESQCGVSVTRVIVKGLHRHPDLLDAKKRLLVATHVNNMVDKYSKERSLSNNEIADYRDDILITLGIVSAKIIKCYGTGGSSETHLPTFVYAGEISMPQRIMPALTFPTNKIEIRKSFYAIEEAKKADDAFRKLQKQFFKYSIILLTFIQLIYWLVNLK